MATNGRKGPRDDWILSGFEQRTTIWQRNRILHRRYEFLIYAIVGNFWYPAGQNNTQVAAVNFASYLTGPSVKGWLLWQ
jgi:hypothetical protein